MVDVLQWTPPAALCASFDVLLSDMMSDTTGVADIDAEQSAALAERALHLSDALLRPGGAALLKLFQSAHTAAVLQGARALFSSARVLKPTASRSESREVYGASVPRFPQSAHRSAAQCS